ncbi:DUF111 family protein [Candidatus Desantisbacteria bacterium]|nr:DUF111 family protein [Candidatus Desantisbacteria bacterium]
MKKSRPAVCFTAICPLSVEKKIIEFVLKNTSTFGVRISNLKREKLKRREDTVNTKYGSLRVKIGYMDNKVIKVSPEYEDVKKIASSCNISLGEIVNEVIKISDKFKE